MEQGKAAFLNYYQAIFPQSNDFQQFLTGLEGETTPILRFDPKHQSQLQAHWQQADLNWQTLDWHDHAAIWPKTIAKGVTLPGYLEHLIYPLNASSLLPVLALKPQPTDQILDACAAPGGKALFIAQHLKTHGHLTANDLSRDRIQRLRNIITDYGAQDLVTITNHNAETIFFNQPNYFDKILLDAPCSSEKHVYQSPKHLKEWSYNRVKQLHKRQISLISGLLQALKSGGELVYSTCAITPFENEAVVAEILDRKQGKVELLDATLGLPAHAPHQSGISGDWQSQFDLSKVIRILPEKNSDLDPMFVAKFRKL